MRPSSDMPMKQSFSLTGNDFYPLIDCSVKYMTYDEKVAYRAKHCIPKSIDQWIEDSKMYTEAPTAQPHKHGTSYDNVECIMKIKCEKGTVNSEPVDPAEFILTLRLRVPPTTSFLMYYWESPTVAIDRFTSDDQDKFAPEWMKTVQTDLRFWQNRPLMLEMMLYFVRNININFKVRARVWSWCKAMSIPAFYLSPTFRQRFVRSRSNMNLRTLKSWRVQEAPADPDIIP